MKIENFPQNNGYAILQFDDSIQIGHQVMGDEKFDNTEMKKELKWSENNRPCLIDSCVDCKGTNLKNDGKICYHFSSCPCYKCKCTVK